MQNYIASTFKRIHGRKRAYKLATDGTLQFLGWRDGDGNLVEQRLTDMTAEFREFLTSNSINASTFQRREFTAWTDDEAFGIAATCRVAVKEAKPASEPDWQREARERRQRDAMIEQLRRDEIESGWDRAMKQASGRPLRTAPRKAF